MVPGTRSTLVSRIALVVCLAALALGCGSSTSKSGDTSGGALDATTDGVGPQSDADSLSDPAADTSGDATSAETNGGDLTSAADSLAIPLGSCLNSVDIQALRDYTSAGGDIPGVLGSCFTNGKCGDPYACGACLREAISTLSTDCAACFGQSAICTAQSCVFVCQLEPGGSACTQCSINAGCRSQLEACIGFPLSADTSDGSDSSQSVDGVTADDAETPDGELDTP